MSEIYVFLFNLIKISFFDILLFVYIIIIVLIFKYLGFEGRDGGGGVCFFFFW